MRQETVAISDVLRQAMETSRPRIEDRNQRLEATLPPATVRVSCDPARLAQVFANLLDNATKYTNEGGEIHLEGRVENGQTVVSVSDTGRGIEPGELPHLFDSFAQGRRDESRPPPGLGLGLSIVRRLVSMHGGSVTAESAGVGRGSRFTVRLPLDRSTACRPPDEAPPAGYRRSLRVLVVDDDPDIAASTGMLLEALGHEVDLAADGDEAIRHARARHHRLILLDIGLRDSSGFQIARRLRRLPQGAGMHIAAITGYDDASVRARMAAAGIDRHLLKPLSLAELQDLIGSVPL
jgi:CheY-like chemotaxis protein